MDSLSPFLWAMEVSKLVLKFLYILMLKYVWKMTSYRLLFIYFSFFVSKRMLCCLPVGAIWNSVYIIKQIQGYFTRQNYLYIFLFTIFMISRDIIKVNLNKWHYQKEESVYKIKLEQQDFLNNFLSVSESEHFKLGPSPYNYVHPSPSWSC